MTTFRAVCEISRVNNPPAQLIGPPRPTLTEAIQATQTAAQHISDVLYDATSHTTEPVELTSPNQLTTEIDAATDLTIDGPLNNCTLYEPSPYALTATTLEDLITEWNTLHPHTQALSGQATWRPYSRQPLQIVPNHKGQPRLQLGQTITVLPQGTGKELTHNFENQIDHLELRESDRATNAPMTPAELRARRELMGLSREETGPVLAKLDGTGNSPTPKTIYDWELGKNPIPPTVARGLRQMSTHTQQTIQTLTNQLTQNPTQPLTAYIDNDDFWTHHPNHHPWPARWWRQACAQAINQIPNTTINYT